MVPSGLRSLLTTGPGPDDGGSKVNQRPHMPDKSGMDAAASVPLLIGATVGATACPKRGVATTDVTVTTKRKYRRFKFMLSSLFHRFRAPTKILSVRRSLRHSGKRECRDGR